MTRLALLSLLACTSPKAVQPPTAIAGTPGQVLTKLYDAPTDGDLNVEAYRLLGVTADGARAYVVRRHVREPERWALDTIDLAHGKRIAASEIAGDRPYFNFVPIGGTLAHDVARFAAIVADTGPWHGRSSGHWLEAQPAADGLIYWSDEHLILADRAGAELRGVAGKPNGLRVSPDRKRAVWIEESPGKPPMLAIGGFGETDQPRRTRLHYPMHEPMWTVDGSAALVLDARDDNRGPTCIVRVDVRDLSTRELACIAHRFAAFVQDPTGATIALVATVDGMPTIEWLDARTGAIKQRRQDPSLSFAEYDQLVLDARGRLVSISESWRTLRVLDLASGTSKTLPAGQRALFEGLRATRWLGDSIIVLRRQQGSIEVVRVDISALLARPAMDQQLDPLEDDSGS